MAVVPSCWPRSFLCSALAALAIPIGLAACAEEPELLPDPAERQERQKSVDEARIAPRPVAPPAGAPVEASAASSRSGPTVGAETSGPEPVAMDGEVGPRDEADDEARRPARARKGRPIEIILRSSPAGAAVAVDGVALGATPAIWEGYADSTPREFTFAMPGYAVARYRFVPTQSGTVHGTLEPIKIEGVEGPTARRAVPPAPGK